MKKIVPKNFKILTQLEQSFKNRSDKQKRTQKGVEKTHLSVTDTDGSGQKFKPKTIKNEFQVKSKLQ